MTTAGLEQELLEATKIKPAKKERQALLEEVVRAVEKLPNDDYDHLSNGAIDWYENAVAAMKKGQGVPEFENGEASDDTGDAGTASVGDTEAAEADGEAAEAAEGAKPSKRAKKAKAAPAPKAAAKPEPKAKVKKPPIPPTATGSKNRYGIYEGTILDDVCSMLEKGCTMAEIKAKHSETKYNLLHRLVKEGHKLEKDEGKFYLTHKDDVAKPKSKKK